jgi:hypothetical protein
MIKKNIQENAMIRHRKPEIRYRDHLAKIPQAIQGLVPVYEDDDDRELPFPRWLSTENEEAVKLYHIRRARYKQLLIEKLEEIPELENINILCQIVQGFSRDMWYMYNFQIDLKLNSILNERKATTMLNAKRNIKAMTDDFKAQKWVFMESADAETRAELMKMERNKDGDVNCDKRQVNVIIQQSDIDKAEKKLDEIIDGEIVDVSYDK